jgi:hypothetical protein
MEEKPKEMTIKEEQAHNRTRRAMSNTEPKKTQQTANLPSNTKSKKGSK